MYNMDISIFGYKIGLNILILIGIIYLILASHTLCGCCNFYSLIEGMDDGSTMVQDLSGVVQKVQAKVQQAKNNQAQSTAGGSTDATPVTATTTTEGFTGANINYGESSVYNLNNTPVDTSSWSAQNMTVVPGQPLSAGVKAFLARPQQQIPLPEGEMLMFANTKFAPEFCPNTYSTSTGCAEMSGAQYNYLVTRGGNNVPYSEY
jgi:outer membrane murein-binding lipoprotein Lpp